MGAKKNARAPAPALKTTSTEQANAQRGKHGLTDMQKLFCEHVAAGLGQTEALRRAGSKATDAGMAVTASRWLRLPKIQQYLASIPQQQAAASATQARILTAIERQQLWTEIALGHGEAIYVTGAGPQKLPPDWPARLKALEALARAQGDFAKDAGVARPAIVINMPSGPMSQADIERIRSEQGVQSDSTLSPDTGD